MLLTIFDLPAMQKLTTEEIIAEKFLNTLYPLIITAKSKKSTLNFIMSTISFYYIVPNLFGYEAKNCQFQPFTYLN